MKFGKKDSKIGGNKGAAGAKLSNPNANQTKRFVQLVLVIIVNIAAIVYVNNLGKKAEETISVVMYNRPIHKNEVITMDVMSEYKMLVGEFEKYAVEASNGKYNRRIVLWEEAPKAVGLFAAYPLQQDTVMMYRDMIGSRIDNSDNVMYTFPGKDIVPLDVGGGELDAFKTFMQPGDRINIHAVYMDEIEDVVVTEYGAQEKRKVEVFNSVPVFKDILIADLLNSNGASVLDIYSSYAQLTIWQQAQYDSDPAFNKSTAPSKLLVALSPQEKDRYFYYLAKKDIKFRVTLPQRIE